MIHIYIHIYIRLPLCKLYSAVLLRRISDKLETFRTPEEMGFRKAYSCSDLVHTLRMISEKSVEWGIAVWAASVDLEKAFDRVLHQAVIEGLRQATIDEATIQAIRQLYLTQFAYIHFGTNMDSRKFSIFRGVR